MGNKPKYYLVEASILPEIFSKVVEAKELLETSPLRSSEIAFQVGYNDAHYFSYLFKKHTGMTPSEYRKSNKNQPAAE